MPGIFRIFSFFLNFQIFRHKYHTDECNVQRPLNLFGNRNGTAEQHYGSKRKC